MKLVKWMGLALLVSFSALVQSAPAGNANAAADQVARLDSIVRLSEAQEKEIEALLVESEQATTKLSREIQSMKIELGQEIGPDFNERAIRKQSAKLGKLSGELTAETALLQAKIQNVLTEDQRAILLKRARQVQQ
ncbi:Spy/CpxP family protein refolding chaperone [Litorivivens lipolytica]|uniref:Spy/CpxP family protein refolding chaperone n=1 Tax=Litorivivens lipolytica TaxID=1524264 RepID=A0A7W4Z5G1_9GAMM|nr:periplasmic heavy metal sensor [Litorivivens lipolytica]MBB3047178.1 Spy/CpxP family protein refolding chaperone [Litorivivens lipolytica]